MNLNSVSSLLLFAFLIFALSTASANDADKFVTQLKSHYQKAPELKAFSLNYHYLGGNDPYQSWDYQSPDRYLALRRVEIDLKNKQFIEHDTHHFPDGLTFNRVQFQNEKESLFYDKNGLTLGKQVRRQSMDSFEEIKGHVFMNVDFLAVTPLLAETDVTSNIHYSYNIKLNETTLTHKTPKNTVIDYVFSGNPLKLVTINNKSQQKVFHYDDYQTSHGINFARSIKKHFDGDIEPTFIHRIDHLQVIDSIEQKRLAIPSDFGPIIQKGSNTLFSKEIATNLYLITDESARRNILFKVNGNIISLFGAPANSTIAIETIKLIQDQFPDKVIDSVYITHPHSDNIRSLPILAERGISIVADAYTIEAIKAYPTFANNIASFNFKTISHNQIIQGVQYYVLENMHAKRQSFVYFKHSGVIYQADFIYLAADNNIAHVMPNATKTFIDFVRFKELKISRIVGQHLNNNISVPLMNEIYMANR